MPIQNQINCYFRDVRFGFPFCFFLNLKKKIKFFVLRLNRIEYLFCNVRNRLKLEVKFNEKFEHILVVFFVTTNWIDFRTRIKCLSSMNNANLALDRLYIVWLRVNEKKYLELCYGLSQSTQWHAHTLE